MRPTRPKGKPANMNDEINYDEFERELIERCKALPPHHRASVIIRGFMRGGIPEENLRDRFIAWLFNPACQKLKWKLMRQEFMRRMDSGDREKRPKQEKSGPERIQEVPEE